MNSNSKGKRGERELARLLRKYGYEDARRGQQYSGANGDADVVGLPGIHVECKRVEKLRLLQAVEQAVGDARENELPAVFHRKNADKKNGKQWLVTMRFEDWMELYRSYEKRNK